MELDGIGWNLMEFDGIDGIGANLDEEQREISKEDDKKRKGNARSNFDEEQRGIFRFFIKYALSEIGKSIFEQIYPCLINKLQNYNNEIPMFY